MMKLAGDGGSVSYSETVVVVECDGVTGKWCVRRVVAEHESVLEFLNLQRKHQFTTGDVTAQPQTGRGHEKHTSHRHHSNKEVCRADKIFQHLNHAAAYVKYYRAPPSWYTRWRATPFRLLEHNGSSEKTVSWRTKHGDRFGNSAFQAQFLDPTIIGHNINSKAAEGGNTVIGTRGGGAPYTFSLQDSVNAAVEFVVEWDAFVSLARHSPYCLELVYTHNFSEAHNIPGVEDIPKSAFVANLSQQHTKSISASAEKRHEAFTPNDDEMEAIGLFRTFVFQKHTSLT